MARRFLALLGLFPVILLANPAGALSYFGELLTSDAAILLPDDIRAHAYLDVEFDPLDVDWSARLVGEGLGEGTVPPTLTFQHEFAPGQDGATLHSATLFIGVRDDFDSELERAYIELDDQFWRQGQATLNLFGGEVTGYLDGNTLDVAISSDAIESWFNGEYLGDFKVTKSLFVAEYTPGSAPGSAAPEPGAALLFGVGALLLRRRLHSC